ncbi:Hypothetical predicted protein [Paramuricea clavata]|uniref:Uncharacterized protein n=1 Tax=Paramuricea clavata TaxID=317549 RepID=A0A6S7IEX5_PARCT|nr:Hypothetical predicted protein [Paramuricea clavata]
MADQLQDELPELTEITLPGDGKTYSSVLTTGSSSIKRRSNDSDDEYMSQTYSDNSQEKRKKIDDFEDEDIMETSPANPAKEETFDKVSDSESSSNQENFNETIRTDKIAPQTNNESQNPFSLSIKTDYELSGMIGEIIELLEEGKTLRESFEDENYCEEFFMSSAKDFASELKKCCFLFTSIKNAMEHKVEKMPSVSDTQTVHTESCVISNDPAERIGVQLSEQQKQYLISKGPHQPVLEKYPCNVMISKSKQNSFSAQWYEKFPYLEYSLSLDRAFCFASSLFGDGAGTGSAETNWSSDGVNRWDKMKSRGKAKKGKLCRHFTSTSHKLAAE